MKYMVALLGKEHRQYYTYRYLNHADKLLVRYSSIEGKYQKLASQFGLDNRWLIERKRRKEIKKTSRWNNNEGTKKKKQELERRDKTEKLKIKAEEKQRQGEW